ncbi:MAG: PA0069 family radical SAM protein [Pseudomonadota bacterium]
MSTPRSHPITGRGALSNPDGRYETHAHEAVDDGWFTDRSRSTATRWRDEAARRIISRNASPDIQFDRSVNPYRGCEHGCVYCFARPTHAFLGHSPGLDFEQLLYAKRNAADVLERELGNPRYQVAPLALGVNTDAYQPLERTLKVTRQILHVLVETRHPVYLITKSSLIERDIDLLQDLARDNLVSAAVSITSEDTELSRRMEPRTASPERRFRTLATLANAGIPTRLSLSPVIPALNESEIESIVQRAAEAGALAAHYGLLRLPHELRALFPEWLRAHYPLRAERVLKAIRSVRPGDDTGLNDARFGSRQSGEGPRAQLIQDRFEVACKRAGIAHNGRMPALNCSAFSAPQSTRQLALFGG